jgi:hypothetical protein
MSRASGLIYVVYAGDDTVTAISIFDKYEQAEEANRRALAFIEQSLGRRRAGDPAYAGVSLPKERES